MTTYLRSLRPVQLRLITAIAHHGKLHLAAEGTVALISVFPDPS